MQNKTNIRVIHKNNVRFSFVRFASQLVTEGVSLLRWLVILVISVFIGKRAIQLGHWARCC